MPSASDLDFYKEGAITVCNMTFNIEPDVFIFHDYTSRVILGLIVLLIFLIGTFGNFSVIVAVILSKRLQTITNVFVINLAVADFFTAAIMPVHAYTLMSPSGCYIPELLCQFVAAATIITFACSVFTLALIAFERLTVIYNNLKPKPKFNNAFSIRNIVFMVSFTWLFPIFLICIFLSIHKGSLGYSIQYKVCTQNTMNTESAKTVILVVCLVGQFPAFVVIVSCYVVILRMYRRHEKKMKVLMAPSFKVSKGIAKEHEINITIEEQSSEDPIILEPSYGRDPHGNEPTENGEQAASSKNAPNQNPSKKSHRGSTQSRSRQRTPYTVAREQRERRLTINFFMVVCAYTICVMPTTVVYLIPGTDPIAPWLIIPFLCNVCVNPIIYALRHPTFSEVLKCMLQCRYKDIPDPSSLLKTYFRRKQERLAWH